MVWFGSVAEEVQTATRQQLLLGFTRSKHYCNFTKKTTQQHHIIITFHHNLIGVYTSHIPSKALQIAEKFETLLRAAKWRLALRTSM